MFFFGIYSRHSSGEEMLSPRLHRHLLASADLLKRGSGDFDHRVSGHGATFWLASALASYYDVLSNLDCP